MTTQQQAALDLAAAYSRALAAEEVESLYDFLLEVEDRLTGDACLLGVDLLGAIRAADADGWCDIDDAPRPADLYAAWEADLLSAEPVRSDDGLSRRVVAV